MVRAICRLVLSFQYKQIDFYTQSGYDKKFYNIEHES